MTMPFLRRFQWACRASVLLSLLFSSLSMLQAQGAPLVASGTFCTQQPGWLSVPVGSAGTWNSANHVNDSVMVNGSGSQIYGVADSFGFAYQHLLGDGSIVARVVDVQGGYGYAAAGIMIRETLDTGSTNATTAYWPTYSTAYFGVRATTSGSTTQPGSVSGAFPMWVKLARSGSTFSSYSSPDGVNWTQVGTSQTISMAQDVYVGLAVASGSNSATATATFDHVYSTSSNTPLPCITTLSATSGDIGSQVVITGSGFGTKQGSSAVLLNGAPVTINFWSDTAISATVSNGATSGNLLVHEPRSSSFSDDSNTVMFTVTSQPLLWGWMDYDLGLELFTATTGSGGGGGGQILAGNATYANQSFVVAGSGLQIYGNSDSAHFVYKQLVGDGSIVARLVSVQGASGWWAAAGLMIRETLATGATSAALVDSPSRGYFGYDTRTTTNGSTNQVGWTSVAPAYWMKLARSGNSFSAYTSPDGVNWTQLGASQTINMAEIVYVGLCVTSSDNSSLATATFDNVSVSSSVSSAPLINTLSATTGPAGSQVLINGSGFGNAQSSSLVTLNSVPVTINFWSDTFISITIPSGATTGNLVVSVAPVMNDSNPVWFTLTSQPLPTGWLDRDVGTVGMFGAAGYANATFTLSGSGDQIYSGADAFHFVYQSLSGDGTITARVLSMQGTAGWWAAAGVMIRETLDTGATNAAVVDSPSPGYFGFDVRSTTNGNTNQIGWTSATPPYWVKLVRSGNTFSGYSSNDGATWTQVGTTQTVNMAQTVYVGLAVESGSDSSLSTATFDNVTVASSLQGPTVGSLSPTAGVEGTWVTITGTNFGTVQGGGNTVSFGSVPAGASTSWSDTQITAIVPSGAATGPVSVVVNGLQSNQNVIFTVSATVIGVSPSSGAALSQVQISGSGFGATKGASTVAFNGVVAPILDWSPISITALVPPGATTGNVVVTIGGVATTGPSFSVTTPTTPTLPNILSISPTSGGAGTHVTINGSGFGAQSTGSVLLGSTIGSVLSWNDNMVVATVNAGSTSGVAQIQQSGYSSNSLPFTVNTTTISGISPNNGLAGTEVTITGSGFGTSQGSGSVWLGTAAGIVTNWNDGEIDATVSAGATSGSAQVLQNGVWSNSVPFTINLPHISGITPTSGSAGTVVTVTGNGFGISQGSGIVWIGNMAGVVSGWDDTHVVASVPSGAVSGVVKVQQNGTWSNAVTFTVPTTLGSGTQVTLVPNVLNMVAGDTRSIQALDSSSQPVAGLTWASSDTTIATLSTDDPPIVTAIAPGTVTITAGSASADVTVYAGPTLPVGTVIWSNPGDGSGVSSIVPAVPSSTGVADVFALNADCKLQAIKSDGTVGWSKSIGTTIDQKGNSSCNQFLPDFQGGAVVNTGQSIYHLDGVTGVPSPAYGSSTSCFTTPVVSMDGTIFAVSLTDVYPTYCNYAALHPSLANQYESWWSVPGSSAAVVAINPLTGEQNFSVSMENSSFSGILPWSYIQPPSVGTPIIAGDGYLYVSYQYGEYSANNDDDGFYAATNEHSRLLRVGLAGDSSKIVVEDLSGSTFVGAGNLFESASNASMPSLITNSDQGVLGCYAISSSSQAPTSSSSKVAFYLATTAGASVSSKAQMTSIPGQQGPIQPILQAQDNSFVGTVPTQTGGSMIAFDQSGNRRWMQPNYTPQVATSDGGVIATSSSGQATTFDQNGNQTGQLAGLFVESWTANAYQLGSIEQIEAGPLPNASDSSYSQMSGANPSKNSTSLQRCATLDSTTNTALESAYSTLTNLLLGQYCTSCNSSIFQQIGTSQAEFTAFLNQGHEFCDGTKSQEPGGSIGASQNTVAAYFGTESGPPDYVAAATAVMQLRTFPALGGLITYSSSERKNLKVFFAPSNLTGNTLAVNESLEFHEALHGFSGLGDGGAPPLTATGLCDVLGATAQTKVKVLYPDCYPKSQRITQWIEETIISPPQ